MLIDIEHVYNKEEKKITIWIGFATALNDAMLQYCLIKMPTDKVQFSYHR